MTLTERVVLINSLYIDINNKNIFDVLSWVHVEVGSQKKDLKNEKFSFND
jgi:hypothetical protein